MRPTGFLLAACLCAILLYDRVSGRFAAAVLAAAPTSAAQSSPLQETRLEKLQHYQVASQLLEMDLAKYRELRKAELSQMVPVVKRRFRNVLKKELQPVWDRMNNEYLSIAWKDGLQKNQKGSEIFDQEMENRRLLEMRSKLFEEALTDARTEEAKAWSNTFEDLPSEKEVRMDDELIHLFTRERDEARAALK
jgi:hypothetical protein